MKAQVFICHSSHDHKYLQEDSLLGYLKALETDGVASFWSDERIVTGDLWDDEVKSHICSSSIALVLVSQALLNSDYVRNEEVPRFVAQRKDAGLIVFPIMLSACEWERHEWLRSTQFLPSQGKTIETDYIQPGPRKQLFLEILKDLRLQISRVCTQTPENPGVAAGQLETSVGTTSKAKSARGRIPETKRVWENPFSLVTANDMSPEEIRSLFVGEYTDFQTTKKHFDTMLDAGYGAKRPLARSKVATITLHRGHPDGAIRPP